jgi:hypothetical protein
MLRAGGNACAEIAGANAGRRAGDGVNALQHPPQTQQRDEKAETHHADPAEEEAHQKMVEQFYCNRILQAEPDASSVRPDIRLYIDCDYAKRRMPSGNNNGCRCSLADFQLLNGGEERRALPRSHPHWRLAGGAGFSEENDVVRGMVSMAVPGHLLRGLLGDFIDDPVIKGIARRGHRDLPKRLAFTHQP